MKRPVLRLRLALGVSLVALALPWAVDRGMERLAERGASALLATVPGLAWDAVEADRGRGVLSVSHLVWSSGDLRLSVGRVSLRDRREPVASWIGSAEAKDGDVTLDDVHFEFGSAAIDVPHVEASGTPLTGADLKAILDPGSALSIEDRIGRLTASSISAGAVTVRGKNSTAQNPRDPLTLRDVAITDAVKGRIGSASIGTVTMTVQYTDRPSDVTSLGPVTLHGIDLPLALTIATGSRTQADAPLEPLVASAAIENMKIEDRSTSMQFGRISAGPLRARPLLHPPADMIALSNKPDSQRTPADQREIGARALDAIGSVLLDRFEMRDVSFLDKNLHNDAKFSRLAISGLGGAKLDGFAFEGFDLHAKDANVALGRFDVEGYDQTAFIQAVVARLGDKGLGDIETQAMAARPKLSSVSLANLHVDAPATGGVGNSPDGQRVVVDVPAVSIDVAEKLNGTATDMSAHVQMVSNLPDHPPASLQPIVDAGFKGLDASLDYAAVYDSASQELNLDKLSISARDLASISTGLLMDKVPPTLFLASNPELAAAAANDVTFKGFTLSLVDAGLAGKLLPLLAKSANVSVPLFKAELKGQAEALLNQALGAGPATQTINSAVATFIDDPRSLRLTVRPSGDGLSMKTISAAQDPRSLLGQLTIEAVANE